GGNDTGDEALVDTRLLELLEDAEPAHRLHGLRQLLRLGLLAIAVDPLQDHLGRKLLWRRLRRALALCLRRARAQRENDERVQGNFRSLANSLSVRRARRDELPATSVRAGMAVLRPGCGALRRSVFRLLTTAVRARLLPIKAGGSGRATLSVGVRGPS